MKTKIFLSLFISLLTLSANAYDFMVDGIAYVKNSGGTSVTVTYTVYLSSSNYNGGSGNLYIPEKVTYEGKTYSVTSIGHHAFAYCSGFSGSLTIPNSVTSIKESAFSECSGLTGSLTIPNSVTSIGSSAFYSCSGLTGSLTIPNSVTSIGSSAFSRCSGLTGSLTIPNTVTSIESSAFFECSGLTGSLTIPNSVTSIGSKAFFGCSGLTGSLNIPNSIASIGEKTFYRCAGFSSVIIPNSVTAIGDYAFSGCTLLKEVNVKCENPPTASINTFSQDSYSNATLFVPKGKSDIYSSTDCWREFTNIKEESGACSCIEGDVNCDGVVDIQDINRIIDIILGYNVKTN